MCSRPILCTCVGVCMALARGRLYRAGQCSKQTQFLVITMCTFAEQAAHYRVLLLRYRYLGQKEDNFDVLVRPNLYVIYMWDAYEYMHRMMAAAAMTTHGSSAAATTTV